MAASLRTFCSIASRQSIRTFSSTCVTHAGKKWRLENGLAHNGSEYGPLTDLPDWSFADGRPAPPLKGQLRRQKQREEFARRAVCLNAEMDEGMKQWCERKEAEKRKEEHRYAVSKMNSMVEIIKEMRLLPYRLLPEKRHTHTLVFLLISAASLHNYGSSC